jgi:hypothetical protein
MRLAEEFGRRVHSAEAFWRAHHDAWKSSQLNQPENCGPQGRALSGQPLARIWSPDHAVGDEQQNVNGLRPEVTRERLGECPLGRFSGRPRRRWLCARLWSSPGSRGVLSETGQKRIDALASLKSAGAIFSMSPQTPLPAL